MSYLPLLNQDAKSVLEVRSAGSYKADRNNIPNNQMLQTLCPEVVTVAKHLGISLADAEYTFTVARNKEGGFNAYQPFVANRDGKAALVWGKLSIDLYSIPGIEIEKGEKDRPIILMEVGDDTYMFPLMFPKDAKVDYATAKKAFKNGSLVDFLAKGFEKPKKLSELTQGDYHVTASRVSVFQGETKHEIFIDGEGWYKANSKITRAIESGLKFSVDEPAMLTCHGEVSKTAKGYSVIGVDIISKKALDLPAFVF